MGKDRKNRKGQRHSLTVLNEAPEQRDTALEQRYERGLAVKALVVMMVIIGFVIVRQLFLI